MRVGLLLSALALSVICGCGDDGGGAGGSGGTSGSGGSSGGGGSGGAPDAALPDALMPDGGPPDADVTAPAPPTFTGTTPTSPTSATTTPTLQGNAERGSVVRVYATAGCAGVVAGMATADTSGAFSVGVTVAPNTSTTFYATATDGAGNVSGCSSGITFVHDSLAPAAPALTATVPPSPSNASTAPVVDGTSEPGATIRLYTTATCTGTMAGSATADGAGAFAIATNVSANSTTSFFATAGDAAGNVSSCSGAITYIHDNQPPARPTFTGSMPTAPSRTSTSPVLQGTAEAGSLVHLYGNASCSGLVIAMGAASGAGTFGIGVTVPPNSSTTFFAATTDAAGNTSSCSVGFTYVHDDIRPATPGITASNPMSPSNASTSPLLSGAAESGTTVRLYTDSSCAGTVAALGVASGGVFAIPVSVTANTSTTFHAAATDPAGNVSGCSTGFTYVHDAIAPAPPALTGTSPTSPSRTSTSPTVSGTTEPSALVRLYTTSNCSGTAAFSGSANGAGAFSIPTTVTANMSTTFFATATDAANNTSGCSNGLQYVHDNIAPNAPTVTGLSPASPSDENAPTISGGAEAGSTVRLFTASGCGTAVVGTGMATAGGTYAIVVNVPDNSTTAFFANATDPAGNPSGCSSSSVTYSEVSPVISGTIQYSGTRGGRVFVVVTPTNNNGATLAGVSIPGPGPYVIRGVPLRGSLNVVAFRDTLGTGRPNGAADPFGQTSVNFTGGNLTNVNVTLVDPTGGTPPAPGLRTVRPSDQSLFVLWDRVRNSLGLEPADHYRVYLDTTPNPGPASHVVQQDFLAMQSDVGVVQGLTNGAQFFVAVSALASGLESPLSPTIGPVTVGPPSGGASAVGTVTLSGFDGSAGTLYAVLYNSSSLVFSQRIPGPMASQPYAITGVPIALNDTYYVLAGVDLDNNGQFDMREPFSVSTFGTQFVTLTGPNTPAPTVQLVGAPALFSVRTDHDQSGGIDDYRVSLAVQTNTKMPVNAVLTSGPPGIFPPIDLGVDLEGGAGNGPSLVMRMLLGTTPPNVGDTYTVNVTFEDATTATLSGGVTGVVPLITSPSPTGTGSTNPLFSWTAPSPAPSSFRYQLDINSQSCCGDLWHVEPLASTRTSAQFNFDGTASGTLSAGQFYSWRIQVLDSNGNSSQRNMSFQAQ